MDYLSNLLNKKETTPLMKEINEVQKMPIDKLLEDLGNEFNIEGRIRASEEMGKLKYFGDEDVVSALTSAAKKAAMQWEIKRMTIASMHGVRPEQVDVKPYADDSRVSVAAVKALRKLASREDEAGRKSWAALENIRKDITNTELLKKISF